MLKNIPKRGKFCPRKIWMIILGYFSTGRQGILVSPQGGFGVD
jgi:hypothetical protein